MQNAVFAKPLFDFMDRFSPLSPETKTKMVEYLDRKTFKKKEIIYKPGDESNKLYFIIKGAVQVCENPESETITHWFATENRFCPDFQCFYTCGPADHHYIALLDTEMLFLRYDHFKALMERPDYQKNVMDGVTAELSNIMQMIGRKMGPAKDRYTNFLEDFPTLANKISVNAIASYLNIAPENISRMRAGAYK